MKTNLKIELLKRRLQDEIKKAEYEQEVSYGYSNAETRRQKWRSRKEAFLECINLIDEILED